MPEDSIRDGARAVELGEKALRISGGKIAMIYKVLAAAYAENGRFADAIQTARAAPKLATNQGNPAFGRRTGKQYCSLPIRQTAA